MAKRQNIDNLIEKQDTETKNKVFEKLQIKLAENDEDISQPNQNALVKKTFLNKKNIFIISVVFLIILACVLLLLLLPKNNPIDEIRYCSVSDYYVEDSEINIGQYAEANDKDILSFDVENKFELLLTQQYKLNITNEIICLYEEIIDNDNFISVFVTDNKTEIDLLNEFSSSCKTEKQIETVTVSYGTDFENGYAKFEYNGYIYYLKVFDNTNDDYVLSLVAELLDVK